MYTYVTGNVTGSFSLQIPRSLLLKPPIPIERNARKRTKLWGAPEDGLCLSESRVFVSIYEQGTEFVLRSGAEGRRAFSFPKDVVLY